MPSQCGRSAAPRSHFRQPLRHRSSWGKVTRKNGKLFAHVFSWPTSGTLQIPAVCNTVNRVDHRAPAPTTPSSVWRSTACQLSWSMASTDWSAPRAARLFVPGPPPDISFGTPAVTRTDRVATITGIGIPPSTGPLPTWQHGSRH